MKSFKNLDYSSNNKNFLNEVKELLKLGVGDPSINDNWAIRWSSSNGHLEIVKELLKDSRVDPSAKDSWAIRWASYYGHLEVVKELLKDSRVMFTSWKLKQGFHSEENIKKFQQKQPWLFYSL